MGGTQLLRRILARRPFAVGLASVALWAAGSVVCADPAPPVTTRTGFDLVRVREGQFSIPLRYGHLIPNTERVDLDGRPLARGRDYTLDETTGAIMLGVPAKEGAYLRISYQYDAGAKQTGLAGAGAGAGQGFKFQLNPSTSATVALGLVERGEDGTVTSSNVFGLQNGFTGGGFKLTGGVFLGQRSQSASTNLFGDSPTGNAAASGQGTAIVQRLQSKFMGGTFTADYQDIDEKFSAVGQLNFAGDPQTLAKERGLKRSAFGFQGAQMMGAPQSFGIKQVGDDQGAVTWREGDVKLGKFGLTWSQQTVDPGFTRFGDLREADRDQLAKERGLTRENLQLSGTGFKLTNDKVQGLDGNGVYHREGSLSVGKATLAFSEQRVDTAFTRFGDLRLQGRDQLAREQGLSRQSLAFGMGDWLNLKSSVVRADQGDFGATDLSFKKGGWSLDFAQRQTGRDFNRLGSLTGQELAEHTAAIEHMIDPTIPLNGGDIGALVNGTGLSRSGLRLGFNSKATQWSVSHEDLAGVSGGLVSDQLAFTGGGTKLNLKWLDTSPMFTEFGRLLPTEQQRLGPSPGLNKLDFSFDRELGKGRSLSFSQLRAHDLTGSADRTTLRYESAPFGLNFVQRDVTSIFDAAPSLSDPERDFLANLRGKGLTEWNYHWSALKNLRLEGQFSSLSTELDQTNHSVQNQTAVWQLAHGLEFRSRFHLDRIDGTTGALRDDSYASFGLVKDFGKIGKIGIENERRSFNGSQDTLPDSNRTGLSYELPISKVFTLSTKLNQTRFDDGSGETTHLETLFAQINSRLGLSFTNSVMRQDLDTQPQTRREFGASIDFGKGIKLNFGQTRQTQDGTQGQSNDQFSISNGEVQGVQIDSAKYTHAGVDDQHDNYQGNFSFRNAKPLQWGGLKDVRFQVVSETVRDNFVWQREDKRAAVGANIGSVALDLGFRSQIAGDQYRAVDRTLKFNSDPGGKLPFRFAMLYGSRTLPNDTSVAVRDYSLTWVLNKGLSLEHSVVTNPLQGGGQYLESTPADERRNQWSLKWTGDKSRKAELLWKEVLRDRLDDALYREATANFTLNADNPSPLTLGYGLVQWERNGLRQTANKFSLGFTQRPGPNQSWSFMLTNQNFGDSIPVGLRSQNWGMRFDFFSRF